jgi:hypothetical protein
MKENWIRSHGNLLILITTLVFLQAACEPDAMTRPRTIPAHSAAIDAGCPIDPIPGDPIPPNCPVDYSQETGSGSFSEQMAWAAPPGTQTWNGETYDDLHAVADRPTCRSTEYITVQVWVVAFSEHAIFYLTSPVPKIADLGWDYVYNQPMAEYAIPASWTYSDMPWRKYKISGGTVLARCAWKVLKTPAGWEVHIGRVTTWGYSGELVYAGGNGTEPRKGRGWSASNSGVSTGEGSADWRQALQKYLDENVCTEGWEIWVDGVQMCRADGTHV